MLVTVLSASAADALQARSPMFSAVPLLGAAPLPPCRLRGSGRWALAGAYARCRWASHAAVCGNNGSRADSRATRRCLPNLPRGPAPGFSGFLPAWASGCIGRRSYRTRPSPDGGVVRSAVGRCVIRPLRIGLVQFFVGGFGLVDLAQRLQRPGLAEHGPFAAQGVYRAIRELFVLSRRL